jgi:hypothetical protein
MNQKEKNVSSLLLGIRYDAFNDMPYLGITTPGTSPRAPFREEIPLYKHG